MCLARCHCLMLGTVFLQVCAPLGALRTMLPDRLASIGLHVSHHRLPLHAMDVARSFLSSAAEATSAVPHKFRAALRQSALVGMLYWKELRNPSESFICS